MIIIEMPKLMKGFEKSITSSRTSVIVSGATAMSALCGGGEKGGHVAAFISVLLYWSTQMYILKLTKGLRK